MVHLFSALYHNATEGLYAHNVYEFLTTGEMENNDERDSFLKKFNFINNTKNFQDSYDHIGAMLKNGIQFINGYSNFNTLLIYYKSFMENFASDGGLMVSSDSIYPMDKLLRGTEPTKNLWKLRPLLGMSGSGLDSLPTLPILKNGGKIIIDGNQLLPANKRLATRDMLYKLEKGENERDAVINITIPALDPYRNTFFYLLLKAPNDKDGVAGADIYPLQAGENVNIIDTNNREAYLFVSTFLFPISETEDVTVNYLWETANESQISGTVGINNLSPRVGDELKGSFDNKGTDFEPDYLWYVGLEGIFDSDPVGAGESFTVTEADLGWPIILYVKDSKTGGLSGSAQAITAAVKQKLHESDVSAIDTAIVAANSAKNNITVSEQPTSSVKRGTKFVTAAEMEALDKAIKIAEAAKTTVNTTAQAEVAANILDSAVAKFKAAIKTGSYKKDDDSSSDSSSSGALGGGSNGTVTPATQYKPQDKPNKPTQVEIKVDGNMDTNGNATVSISDKNVDDAIKKAEDKVKKNGIVVSITMDTKTALKSFTATLPKATLEKLIAAEAATLTINGGASLTFDLEAIKEIKTIANGDVAVTATKTDNTGLSKEVQTATGGRPVYDFKVTGDGKNITTFSSGKIALSIPYELQRVDENGNHSETGSLENPDNLVGLYVDENGKLNYLLDSEYNATNKTMLINTTHLSVYAVAYKTKTTVVTDTVGQTSTVTFSDIANHWAKEDIEFVTVRGVLAGTGNNQFSPNNSMTRGMFVTALGRLAEVNTEDYKAQVFADVKTDAYYATYANWAKSKNIVTGTSATTFSPEQSITRQEMALMLQNYTKAIDYKLPSVHQEIIFTDADNMGTWAQSAVKDMQMAGILMGRDGGNFDPSGTATRAEVSAMIRRFVEIVASRETVEG